MPRAAIASIEVIDQTRTLSDADVAAIVAALARLEQLQATVTEHAARIAALERARRVSTVRQRAWLLLAIATQVGPGVVFGAADLWRHRHLHPELQAALTAAGVRSPHGLGKCLERLRKQAHPRVMLERIGRDNAGVIWRVTMR